MSDQRWVAGGAPGDDPPSTWPSRRRRLLLCLALLCALQAANLARRGIAEVARQPAAGVRACRLDPNRASVAELMALPGIGRSRAAAIILHRVRAGPFRRTEDLLGVDGIGPECLRSLQPFLVIPAASFGGGRTGS